MRTNVLPADRSTAPLQTAALLLTPFSMDIPNAGPSTRTSPLIKRAAPVTQRALRNLRRESRREVEEEFFSRSVNPDVCSNFVLSTNPGSIPHTNQLTDKRSPAKMRISERVPQRDTDCHAHSLVRHSLLPCKLPSSVVHPRAPSRETTMSLSGSTTRTSAAATHLTASAPAGQGSSAAPASLDSAPTSPVGTLALRVISGSGPGRSRGHRSSPPPPPTMPPPPTCNPLRICGRKCPRTYSSK